MRSCSNDWERLPNRNSRKFASVSVTHWNWSREDGNVFPQADAWHCHGRAGGLHRRYGVVPFWDSSFRLPYRQSNQDFVNLVGIIPGTGGGTPLLVGAHYDSVIEAPCADDNAAAVAIALEVGRTVGQKPLERDLVIAIFDAEEPSPFQGTTMGSSNFYQKQTEGRGFHAAVVMDLVGHDVPLGPERIGAMLGLKSSIPELPDLRDLVFVTGAESHPALPGIIETTPEPDGIRVLPTLNEYVGDMSDHGIFRKNGVPYFFLSCGHWEHYHRTTAPPTRRTA